MLDIPVRNKSILARLRARRDRRDEDARLSAMANTIALEDLHSRARGGGVPARLVMNNPSSNKASIRTGRETLSMRTFYGRECSIDAVIGVEWRDEVGWVVTGRVSGGVNCDAPLPAGYEVSPEHGVVVKWYCWRVEHNPM